MAETQILRPTGVNSRTYNGSNSQYYGTPSTGDNLYQNVDEASKNEADYNYGLLSLNGQQVYDILYTLEEYTGSNSINKVTVKGYYFLYEYDSPAVHSQARFRINSGGTVYNDSYFDPSTSAYGLHSKIYTTNPKTSAAWTKEEVNALLAGDSLEAYTSNDKFPKRSVARCCQYWVEVEYEPISIPESPANVAASENNSSKVIVTWTKSEGATGYKIYRDGNLIDTVGDVATYDDTGAAAPVITPGTAAASDGTSAAHVALSLSGNSIANGTTHSYTVKATNAAGDSAASSADNGYRLAGSIEYQWQRSAADSDVDYSNIDGATTASYNDTGAPSNGSGRYFKCVLSATGSSNQTSTADRGYRITTATLTTQAASDLDSTSVTANGTITATGGGNATRRGFCYVEGSSGDPDPTTADSTAYDDGDFGTGAYNKSLTGLTPETSYLVRAYAVNVAGTSYGDTVIVVTQGSGAPTVTTQAGSGIESTYFTGNGNITSIGEENATRRGFCYMEGTYGDPDMDDDYVDEESDPVVGNATRANMKISAIDGTAFVDFSTADVLTNYLGGKLTITDSAGKKLVGYIKAAGTGETYDSNLLAGLDFTSGWSAINAVANTASKFTWDGSGIGAALSQTTRNWRAMCAAPNGNIYACVAFGDIYMQTAGAGDFVALSQTSRNWMGMCAAPNGNIYACDYGGDIYMQTAGAGDFVALSQTTRNWIGMCAAPNGNIYACVFAGGDIYMQTAGAGDFVALSQTTRYWYGMCAAPNGNIYACVFDGGDIYMQTAGAGDFVALSQTSRDWRAMCAAPNGNIYACVYGDIYMQTAGAGDFVALSQTSRNWRAMCAAPNGNIYACVYDGDIYDVTITTAVYKALFTNLALYKVSGTATVSGADRGYIAGFGSNPIFYYLHGTGSGGSGYGTCRATYDSLFFILAGNIQAGAYMDVSAAEAKQVLTSSATGVTIVSTKGGTTYNWASKDVDFNYYDASGYTYEISEIGFSLGAYALGIDYLSPGTAYRVRAFAENSYGLSYGNTVTVTTSVEAPTVTTGECTDVLDTSVTGNGNITVTGGDNCSRRGFIYVEGSSGDPDPTLEDSPAPGDVYEDDDWGTGAFSLSITGLTQETSYLVRAYAINDGGTSYGETVIVVTGTTIVAPTVTTSAATNVEQTSCTGNGNITDMGGANATVRGFCYMTGTSGDPDTADSVVYEEGDFGVESFALTITGLYPGTAYRVRAYATNPTGTGYGDTVQVTTVAGAPVVSTQTCTNIAGTSATGNGTVLATGGYNVTRRGFCYMTGTTGDPTTANSTAYDDGDFGAVAFTKSITGLSPGTAYRVRAYAVNSLGTSYGATVQLTTAVVAPTVTTQAATDVLHNSCTGNGNITATGGANCTRRGFCYMTGTSGDPTTANSVAYDDGSFSTGAFTKSITGLSPSTGYRVRAYAVNSAGVSYGTTVQVNTSATPVIPTVTTQAASDVTYNSCTGNGNITNIGNVNCTRRGFCYMVGTSGDPDTADSVVYEEGDFGVESFALTITGLYPGTSYRVRAYAVNSAGTGYGTTVQVNILAVVPPTVTTQAVSDEGPSSVMGNGNITATGGENCTRRGFCYKTGLTGDPTITDSVVDEEEESPGYDTGAFALELTDLAFGTYYRVRAFAENSAGVAYGTTVQAQTTANPNFIAEKNKRADGPTPINLITFGFATPVYVSDRDVTPSGGPAHLGLVKSWGFIDTSISQQAGQGVLGKIAISDLQLTLINTEAARFSSNFTTADPPENITVTLYQWFEPILYSEKEIIFKGVIFGQPEYNEYECKLTIRGIFEKYNRQIGADKIITAADFPDADPDDIGKMSNIGYGDLKDVPCRALKSGRIDTLRDDLTAAATSFYVSGEAAADFPAGLVTVQIDAEQIRGTYSQTTKQFTACTRAYGGTTAAAHDKGAQVAQILTEYIYEVFGHPAKSLSDVRVDGVKQTTGFTAYTGQTGDELAGYEGRAVIKFTTLPTLKKQVNLDVDEGNHSHGSGELPVVTWYCDDIISYSKAFYPLQMIDHSYNTQGLIGIEGSAQNVSGYVYFRKNTYEVPAGTPTRLRACMRTGSFNATGSVAIGFNAGPYGPSVGGYVYANTTYKGAWTAVGTTFNTWAKLNAMQPFVEAFFYGFDVGIAEVWFEIEYRDLHPATGVALVGNTSAETVIGGLVTCDAEGALDDTSGTYTGTASARIERPDHVFRHIWAALMSAPAADIDEETFAAAGVFYAANSYKFAKLISDPITAEDLLMRLSLQSRSRFICTAAGQAKLFVRQLDQVSTHAVVKNEIKRDSMSIRRSPTDELINLFNISYDLDLTQGAHDPAAYRSSLKFTDATSVTRYGTREWKGGNDVFCFDAVRDADMAEHVGDFILAYHCRVRKVLAFGVFLDNMEIAPGDIIDVTHTLDALTAFVCEVEKVVHHIGSYKQIDWLQIIATENAT